MAKKKRALRVTVGSSEWDTAGVRLEVKDGDMKRTRGRVMTGLAVTTMVLVAGVTAHSLFDNDSAKFDQAWEMLKYVTCAVVAWAVGASTDRTR